MYLRPFWLQSPRHGLSWVANQGGMAPALHHALVLTCEGAMVTVIYKFLQPLFGCFVP